MKRVDEYINSVYKNFKTNDIEINDLKLDMKNHLLESINDLKKQGYSDEKSIDIALERFGNKHQLEGQLTQVFNENKNNTVFLLLLSLIFIPIIYILSYFTGIDTLDGRSLLIILIPIYTLWQIFSIVNKYKKNISVNNFYEITRFFFIIYLVILFSILLFPVYVYPSLYRSSLPIIAFNPIQLIEHINWYLIKSILFFIPLGIFLPIINSKFKSLRNTLLFTFLIFFVQVLSTLIKCILGISLFSIISVDNLILYIIGTLTGYFIYFLLLRTKKYINTLS